MDLKGYYRNIRELSARIEEDYPVLVSLGTPDGGKAGVYMEASRALAAKLMVEGRARLATADEASAYREAQAEAKRLAEQAAAASRMQLTVLTTADLNRLRGSKSKE
jgi:hypothetical protein